MTARNTYLKQHGEIPALHSYHSTALTTTLIAVTRALAEAVTRASDKANLVQI